MGDEFHSILGLGGAIMVVCSYLMLQLDRIASESISYSLLNAVGAGLILYSLVFDFNLAAVIIEVFWVMISMIGVWKYLRGRHTTMPTQL